MLSREGGSQNGDADDEVTVEERETAYAQLITAEPEFLVSEVRKRYNSGSVLLHIGGG